VDLAPSLTETRCASHFAQEHADDPQIGEDLVPWCPPNGDVSTRGLVDFSMCPHVNGDGMPGNTMAEAWAASIDGPAYAVDDHTAIKLTDGRLEVVSEGRWKRLPADAADDGDS
jgi:dipeptidase E